MRIKGKLLGGIGALIVLLAVVGLIGWYGLSRVGHEMDSVLHQLEIAKEANQALKAAGETQGHALRTIIYKDEQYVDLAQEGVQHIVNAAEKTKSLVSRPENRELADAVKTAAEHYGQGIKEWWRLQEAMAASREISTAAAVKARDRINEMIKAQEELIRNSTRQQQVSETQVRKLMLIEEIRDTFRRMWINGLYYQQATDSDKQASIRDEWLVGIDDTSSLVAAALFATEDPSVEAALNDVNSSLAQYREQVVTFCDATVAQSEQLPKLKMAAESVSNGSIQVRSAVYETIDAVATNAQAVETSMVTFILIAGIISALLGVIIGLLLTGHITKGLNSVVSAIGNIAGNGDVAVNIDKNYLERRDEIGDLAKAAELVLNDYRSITQVAQKLSAGDWSVEIATKSDVDAMNQSLAAMVKQVNETLSAVTSSGEQIAAGASQVSNSSQSLSQGATESAASLEEITSSMHEMGAQTEQNAENAGMANKLAEEAQVAAKRGDGQMTEMVTAMHDINESGQNISKIIKVIDEIAFQTNLLALNAAVEAARAGQHGKGFAVVAEEVRNLAARSAKAASETADLIEGSVEKTRRGADIADQTAAALREIVTINDKVNNLVAEIATASHEQAQGIGQINQGLTQIDQVTQSNTASAEESAAAAEELNSQAEKLRQMMASFKLGGSCSGGFLQKPHQPEPRKISSQPGTLEWGEQQNNDELPKIALDDADFGRY